MTNNRKINQRGFLLGLGLLLGLGFIGPATALGQEVGGSSGIQSEQSLPSRYPFVVQDMLEYSRPSPGFWVDLGAGKGQVAIPLIEASGNPVVMLDPDAKAMSEGLQLAREKGLAARLSAVVGVAEKMPFPDNSVDFMASRGSIFFWDDPVKGLQEIARVLRPGGKAYLGGGAGRDYPAEAVKKLIESRVEKMAGDEPEKWNRFVELRRPEQMRKWAEDAGLLDFTVMGQGAISAEDQRVGQGVWLLFEKRTEVVTKKEQDKITAHVQGNTTIYSIDSPSGIGGATIAPALGWPERIVFRLRLRGLESFTVSNGEVKLSASVLSHGDQMRLLHLVVDGKERPVKKGSPYWTEIKILDADRKTIRKLPDKEGCFEMTLPPALIQDRPKSLTLAWIDFYRS